MQLMLIFGIIFAIGSVTFALQNNVPVTVTFAGGVGTAAATAAGDLGRIAWRASVDSSDADAGGAAAGGGT